MNVLHWGWEMPVALGLHAEGSVLMNFPATFLVQQPPVPAYSLFWKIKGHPTHPSQNSEGCRITERLARDSLSLSLIYRSGFCLQKKTLINGMSSYLDISRGKRIYFPFHWVKTQPSLGGSLNPHHLAGANPGSLLYCWEGQGWGLGYGGGLLHWSWPS